MICDKLAVWCKIGAFRIHSRSVRESWLETLMVEALLALRVWLEFWQVNLGFHFGLDLSSWKLQYFRSKRNGSLMRSIQNSSKWVQDSVLLRFEVLYSSIVSILRYNGVPNLDSLSWRNLKLLRCDESCGILGADSKLVCCANESHTDSRVETNVGESYSKRDWNEVDPLPQAIPHQSHPTRVVVVTKLGLCTWEALDATRVCRDRVWTKSDR